jgi:DNA modification methylase
VPFAEVFAGDCLEALALIPDESIDAVVTDPPYGLAFLGQKWDSFKATNEAKSQVVKGLGTGMRMTTLAENRNFQEWSLQWTSECLRVLKPGGWLLAFGGSRTYHRLACAVEEAGFDVRDQLLFIYGQGFPKSMDVSKAIDRAAGAEREVTGEKLTNVGMQGGNFANASKSGVITLRDKPATSEAQQWEGWGTALKPAHEPIVMARKPFKGTVANNVLLHGTGAINIDGCRVEGDRWPANLIHDGSEAVEDVLGKATGYFYCAKPSKKEKDRGCEDLPITRPDQRTEIGMGSVVEKGVLPGRNSHPTVKPIALMRYLCRLVTPPGGLVLDPFMGSGTTGIAALEEGFDFAGIEKEQQYIEIAKRRVSGHGFELEGA